MNVLSCVVLLASVYWSTKTIDESLKPALIRPVSNSSAPVPSELVYLVLSNLPASYVPSSIVNVGSSKSGLPPSIILSEFFVNKRYSP